jgi:hypothetical protein
MGGSGAGGSQGTGGGTASSTNGSTSSSSGCDFFANVTYTFTLASGFDWSTVRVGLNATAYDSTNTAGSPMGMFLGEAGDTVVMSYMFSNSGCVPNVDVSLDYSDPVHGDFECSSMATHLADDNIIIQPPTNIDTAAGTCTAPTPQ